eukprot:TRINITY_DN2762_c1_g4_i1.p1 TRINITY_DN2762_c1_g4~~TRINITY_DN2762_c1_g4_i1.p1  ORF type:complete len:338 (+),score=-70.02 TRINITY_DN2762_c1_g4_i1:266-1279(+)
MALMFFPLEPKLEKNSNEKELYHVFLEFLSARKGCFIEEIFSKVRGTEVKLDFPQLIMECIFFSSLQGLEILSDFYTDCREEDKAILLAELKRCMSFLPQMCEAAFSEKDKTKEEKTRYIALLESPLWISLFSVETYGKLYIAFTKSEKQTNSSLLRHIKSGPSDEDGAFERSLQNELQGTIGAHYAAFLGRRCLDAQEDLEDLIKVTNSVMWRVEEGASLPLSGFISLMHMASFLPKKEQRDNHTAELWSLLPNIDNSATWKNPLSDHNCSILLLYRFLHIFCSEKVLSIFFPEITLHFQRQALYEEYLQRRERVDPVSRSEESAVTAKNSISPSL